MIELAATPISAIVKCTLNATTIDKEILETFEIDATDMDKIPATNGNTVKSG